MGNNFRVYLAARHKKIADVHKGTGLSKTTLTNFYYERSNPDSKTLVKIADYLNVSIDDLIGREVKELA